MQPKIIEAATNGSDSSKRVIAGATANSKSSSTAATYEEHENIRYTVGSDVHQEEVPLAKQTKYVSGSALPALKRTFGHISMASAYSTTNQVLTTSPDETAYTQSADGPSKEMIGNRPYRGRCLYQSRKCENERALKRNGKAHNLCNEHRSKQNQHQRKFDAKKFSRKRRKNSTGEVSMLSKEGDESVEQVRPNNDQPPTRPHVVIQSQPSRIPTGFPQGAIQYEQYPNATTGYYAQCGHHLGQGSLHHQRDYYSPHVEQTGYIHPTSPQDRHVVYHQYPPHSVVERSASERCSSVAAQPAGVQSLAYTGAPVNYKHVPQAGAFVPAPYVSSNGQNDAGSLRSFNPPNPCEVVHSKRNEHFRDYPQGLKITEMPIRSGYSASELAAASILAPSGLASSSVCPGATRTLASAMPTDAEKQEYYLRIVAEQKKIESIATNWSPRKDSCEKKLPSLQIPVTTTNTKSIGTNIMSMSNVTSHAGALHNSGPPPVIRLPIPGSTPRLPSLAPLRPTIPPGSSRGSSPTKK
jgi:hypothetical protein